MIWKSVLRQAYVMAFWKKQKPTIFPLNHLSHTLCVVKANAHALTHIHTANANFCLQICQFCEMINMIFQFSMPMCVTLGVCLCVGFGYIARFVLYFKKFGLPSVHPLTNISQNLTCHFICMRMRGKAKALVLYLFIYI